MTDIIVAPYEERDRSALVAGYADLQEVERAFTDTRRPGAEIAESYIGGLFADIQDKSGAMFVARDGVRVAGFIACWIEHDENVAETPDSTTYGYIPDAYVFPEYRGAGVFRVLNDAAEAYLVRFPEVRRIRINVLTRNERALNAYRKAGYDDYETMLEKKVR